MLPFAYYLLKITICSAVLFGYYWFLLRNKVFHGYNRFYLLAIVGLSILLPLCRINIFAEKRTTQTSVIKMLQVVTDGDEYMDEVIISSAKQNNFSFVDFLPFAYTLVSIILFALLIQMLLGIFILYKNNRLTKIEHIHFINTDAAKGTPFSFFKYIFWNNQINLQSAEGKRIFKHELAHIQELHSWDKMFINLVLIAFWSNPIFWLIRKELSMIHEFIADKKAVEDGDTAAFAAMILATTYPQHNITIANNFFYSPIKRRLMMLTKNNNPSVNYISRLLVLPVLVIVFAAFTIKANEYNAQTKTQNKNFDAVKNTNASNSVNPNNPINLKTENTIPTLETNNEKNYLDKQITVVIDAGHGGTDPGAINKNGTTEKAMALLLAKKIKELNKDKNINIILSRESDVFNSVIEKAIFANSQKPDLFISIHLSGSPASNYNKNSGLEIFIATDSFPNSKSSRVLGSAVLGSFKNNYNLKLNDKLQQRKAGIWVLKSVEAPSILIEAGYITNDNDLAYLQSETGQEAFANNVLNGISNFVSNQKASSLNDKINNKIIEDVDRKNLVNYIESTKITDDNYAKVSASEYLNTLKGVFSKNENGDIVSLKTNQKPNNYESYLADEKAYNQMLHKQQKNILLLDTPKNREVFTKTEKDPEFIGGVEAWKKFLQANLDPAIPITEGWKTGQYKVMLKFIVEKDGTLTNVITENYKNSKTAQHCIKTIKNGPKWKPALQNGHVVAAYRRQPITFVVEEAKIETKPVNDLILRLDKVKDEKVKLEDFIKYTEVTTFQDFKIVSSNVYFLVDGLTVLVSASLQGNSLAPMKEVIQKCKIGSKIVFTNIKIKTKDGIRAIDEVSFTLN